MTIRDGYLQPESVLQAAALIGCKCESWCLGKWGDGGCLTVLSVNAIAARVKYRVYLTEVAKAIEADTHSFRIITVETWDGETVEDEDATLTELILADGDISEVQRLRDAIEKAQDE